MFAGMGKSESMFQCLVVLVVMHCAVFYCNVLYCYCGAVSYHNMSQCIYDTSTCDWCKPCFAKCVQACQWGLLATFCTRAHRLAGKYIMDHHGTSHHEVR